MFTVSLEYNLLLKHIQTQINKIKMSGHFYPSFPPGSIRRQEAPWQQPKTSGEIIKLDVPHVSVRGGFGSGSVSKCFPSDTIFKTGCHDPSHILVVVEKDGFQLHLCYQCNNVSGLCDTSRHWPVGSSIEILLGRVSEEALDAFSRVKLDDIIVFDDDEIVEFSQETFVHIPSEGFRYFLDNFLKVVQMKISETNHRDKRRKIGPCSGDAAASVLDMEDE